MIEIKKDIVLIPLSTWNELKKIDYFKEIIEVLEDSALLEKTKKESTNSIDLDEYIKEREKKEHFKRSGKMKKIKMKKVIV